MFILSGHKDQEKEMEILTYRFVSDKQVQVKHFTMRQNTNKLQRNRHFYWREESAWKLCSLRRLVRTQISLGSLERLEILKTCYKSLHRSSCSNEGDDETSPAQDF